MTKIFKAICFIALLTMIGCSDGMQVGQKINSIIKEDNISTVIIQTAQSNGKNQQNQYPVSEFIINNQFATFGNQHINLVSVKSLEVSGNQLKINM